MANKLGRGRPSKYKKKYCKMIEDFFDQPPNRRVIKKEIIKSNGTIEREYVDVANPLPTIIKFARHIGVNPDTITEWSNAKTKAGKLKYPDFSVSYRRAMRFAQDHLVDNGLAGLSPAAAFIFVAKNYTEMRDKQEVDHTSKGERVQQVVGFTYVNPEKPDEANKTSD